MKIQLTKQNENTRRSSPVAASRRAPVRAAAVSASGEEYVEDTTFRIEKVGERTRTLFDFLFLQLASTSVNALPDTFSLAQPHSTYH